MAPPDHLQLERFAFTLRDAVREPERIRFVIDQNEIVKQWCEAQTPYLVTPPRYACVPAGEAERVPGGGCVVKRPEGPFPVDCDKLNFCWGMPAICGCDANQCEIAHNSFVRFDMRIEGRTADGSAVFESRSGAQWRVHLQRERRP